MLSTAKLAKAVLLPFVHKKGPGRPQKIQIQELLQALGKKNQAETLHTVLQILRQETGPWYHGRSCPVIAGRAP
jgi:transposase